MIKSLKGQFILAIFVAIGFVYVNFSSIEFIADKRDPTVRVMFFFIMILSVFNTGCFFLIEQLCFYLSRKILLNEMEFNEITNAETQLTRKKMSP
ncbi:hypothetical protein M3589_16845 [Heyndrickxia oleronia]|uniref:hypothetical protein n=1 Tax=Heyndrickxia oleronia TaxID=38875 RepID=UPI00203A6CE7|nr:hypothetical protein [Heyndrickxia oleronia]MCM3239374.1 hypothetical protein [Heyndrickxia oleronia]